MVYNFFILFKFLITLESQEVNVIFVSLKENKKIENLYFLYKFNLKKCP